MRKILFLLAVLSSFFPMTVLFAASNLVPMEQQSKQQEASVKADFSSLRRDKSEKVSTVIDSYTMLLKSGRMVRLSGLDFPDFDSFEPGEMSGRAKDYLKENFEGKNVILYVTNNKNKGRVNRMGHELVHMELADTGLWAQGALLSEGLARARTSKRNPEMADQMYKLEQIARKEEKGIWGKVGVPVLTTEMITDYEIGSFQIVEGVVYSVANVKNKLYLNFGVDWRKDFTVSMKSGDRMNFIKEGIDPMALSRKKIRVRGWLREWNGPFMEVDHPQSVELIGSE